MASIGVLQIDSICSELEIKFESVELSCSVILTLGEFSKLLITGICVSTALLLSALVEAFSVVVIMSVSNVVTGAVCETTRPIVSVRGSILLLMAGIAFISSCVRGIRSEKAALIYVDPITT